MEATTDGRRRKILIIVAVLLILVIAGIALLHPQQPQPTVRAAPYYDYSALMQIMPNRANIRHPTAEEMRKFPLGWPTVPVEQNAAFYYVKAASLLPTVKAPPGSAESVDKYAGDQAALESWIASNKAVFDGAVQAQAYETFRLPLFMGATSNAIAAPYLLAALRSLARRCSDAGFVEELKGRPDAAAEWYLADLRMGTQVRHGTMIHSMVGVAICAIGAGPLDPLVASAALSDGELRKVIAACRAAETAPAEIADILGCEAEFADASAERRGFGAAILELIKGERKALGRARRDAGRPLYEVLGGAEAQALFNGTPAKPQIDNACWRWRDELGRLDVRLRAMQVRAAMALYQRKRGKLPENLDALCPEFLPQVPLDPYSGAPMRYAIAKDGWRLWSVGRDLKDDGGKPELTQWYGNFWDGKDYVFVPAPPSKLAKLRQNQKWSNGRVLNEPQAQPGPSFDGESLDLTPLHVAANRGDVAAAEALLTKGADVNARGLDQQTPLHLAVKKEMVELLLSKGAQIEARDHWGRTPLFWAAGAGRKDVVEALLSKGAQADAPETADPEAASIANSISAQFSKKPGVTVPTVGNARTPITCASEQGYAVIAELLRKHAADAAKKKQADSAPENPP